MARTRASVGAKVASGKSSKARCSAPHPSSSNAASGSSDKPSRSTGGGNPVCPRETPQWQKPITRFFITKEANNETNGNDPEEDIVKTSKPKHNVIESDSDEEVEIEKPTNRVLEESIELEPLNGEDSHKIDEYYPKNWKGKGKGKKTEGKENKFSEKRLREEDGETQDSKRVKVTDD